MLQNKEKINKERGVSLYLAVITLSILLALALGMSSIFLGQKEMLKSAGYSVIAFYAADAGIEKALGERDDPCSLNDNLPESFSDDGPTYQIEVSKPGAENCFSGEEEEDCSEDEADNYCIKSIGSYKEVSRAIRITY